MAGNKIVSLQSAINSSLGVGIALLLGRITPNAVGYPVAQTIARIIARQKKTAMVNAVRSNQWVVRDERLSHQQLDDCALDVFRSQAHCLFDFYHNLNRPQKVQALFQLTPAFQKVFDERLEGKHGALFLLPHLSAFDLAGYAMAMRGLQLQVLSTPKINSGYAWQNHMRRQQGLETTPTTPGAFHQARLRLEQGGTVLTGLDRPNPGSTYKPRFFGHPAALPVFYVRLAINTHVPIYVVAVIARADGSSYLIDASEPITMKPNSDPHQEIIQNAETVLRAGEFFIRSHPEQWAMFFPVWPDLLVNTP
jgi:phosphatidylinositol dimannoside acyltransferase